MGAVTANKLWIVEKPSMAEALVAGLEIAFGVRVINNPRADWYHRLSNGDVVCPLLGHVIEMVLLEPKHRSAKLGTYFDFLPVKNRTPPYRPRADTDRATGKPRLTRAGEPIPTKAYEAATMLLRNCREIVNAGDTDREGQRIFDELVEYVGIDPDGGTKPVWRLPLNSARAQDIAKQVTALERNSDPKWRLRGVEAFVRQLLDMTTGLNGSMAMQEITGRHNMSVGRVQTPVLWIVDERDRAIETFRPRDYFVPVITMADGTELRWHERNGAAGLPGFDEVGRIIDRQLAQQIVDRIARGLAGKVTAAESHRNSVAPPMPFTNASLASTAAKRYGMTPKEAEKAAQALYERHKAISYVGTECQFLPESMLADARGTLQALSQVLPGKASGADLDLRSAAWNDAKVGDHHAIIPTGALPQSATVQERQVFETVAKRYIAQFYPAHVFMRHALEAMFGEDEFRASRREVVQQGWKSVEEDGDGDGSERRADADVDGDANQDTEGSNATDVHAAKGSSKQEPLR